MDQIKPTDSPGCHRDDSMSAFPTLSDAASATDVSLANKQSTLAPLDTSTLLVRSSCFHTSSVHMQLDSSSLHFHTHLLLIHTHMPLSAMISGRLDSLSLPAKCPQPRLKAGSTHTGGRKKKMRRTYLFQSLTQFQEIIGRYFKDADDRILKKNVKIQLAKRV